MKTEKLIKAADNVLAKLNAMSDEQILQALEACKDNSISYATNYDDRAFTQHNNFGIDELPFFTSGMIANISSSDINASDFRDSAKALFAANDEFYALAA